MVKPAFSFARFFCVGLLLAFLVSPASGADAESSPPTPSDDLGLEPSQQPQAREALDSLQTIIDSLQAGQRPPQAPPEEPTPDSVFGELESLLNQNRNVWYVVLFKLALAGVLGLTLALVYRSSYTGKKKKYKPAMMQSQLLLCTGGALVWIIIANNLVRAFGLAGMVGLIRYRTPVRDPKDNVMVFLSMAIGMACGLGQIAVAVVSTAFTSLVLFAIYQTRLGKKKKKPKAEEPALLED